MKAKQTKIQYVNFFTDMEFLMDYLAGKYDSAIKKGKMKIKPAYDTKEVTASKTTAITTDTAEVTATTTEATEVISSEVIATEEVVGPVIDDDYDSEDNAPKSTDLELATSVALDILEGTATDMSPEDFTAEVWAEAYAIANEEYYSSDDIDYKEEVSPEGETVIVMSLDRLNSFMTSRANTIESWDNSAEITNDEVNAFEECAVTVLDDEDTAPTKLDTLLDTIIENQEEFKDRYERSYATDESYMQCPSYHDFMRIGIEACDLSDKALARALYKDLRFVSSYINEKRPLRPGEDKNNLRIYKDKFHGYGLYTRDDLLDVLIHLGKLRISTKLDFYGIRDEVNALICATA